MQFAILVLGNRVRESDIAIFQELAINNVPTVVVRSMWDIDGSLDAKANDTLTARVRASCAHAGIKADVYFVSTRTPKL